MLHEEPDDSVDEEIPPSLIVFVSVVAGMGTAFFGVMLLTTWQLIAYLLLIVGFAIALGGSGIGIRRWWRKRNTPDTAKDPMA